MFGKSIRLARILGISIELDLSWFVIFFLVAWSLSKGYFPYYYPEIETRNYWIMGLVASLLLFSSVLLHELSHSWVALRNKLPISKITLFIFGGVASMAEEPKRAGIEFRVAAAGPLCSFILMFAFRFLSMTVEEGQEIYAVLKYVSMINGFLAFFNLVPGFPLDGGRLLRSAMWYFTGNFKGSTRVASNIGKGFAFFLMAFGFLQVMTGYSFNGLWLIFIGYFLQNAAVSSYRQVVMKELLSGMTVEKIMNKRVISVSKDLTLKELVDDYFVRYHFDSFPVMEGERAVGVITMSDIKRVERDEWDRRYVGDIMARDLVPFAISPADGVEAVLKRMVRDDMGWFLVLEDDMTVRGILTRSDIIHLLEIKSDLGVE